LSVLSDELAGVEYDFFEIVCSAAKRGFTRKDIDRAYRAASAQALCDRPRGRPDRSFGKMKNTENHLNNMRDTLILDPDKAPFTVAREVLSDIPINGKPTPQHLARVFKKNKKLSLYLQILSLLKKLARYEEQRGKSSAALSQVASGLIEILRAQDLAWDSSQASARSESRLRHASQRINNLSSDFDRTVGSDLGVRGEQQIATI
jgi:hypothetical protein